MGNVDEEDRNPKRARPEKSNTDLVSPKDEESWRTLVRVAVIRKHQPLLVIVETVSEGGIPEIYYHSKCRSIFTMKKLLEKISQETAAES